MSPTSVARTLLLAAFAVSGLLFAGPTARADIKMHTARRELGQKMRFESTAVLRATRDRMEGRVGAQIPPLFDSGELIGDDDLALVLDDPNSGESLFIDTTGGLGLASDTVGHLQGTLQFGGTQVLPGSTAYDVDLVAQLGFTTTTPGSIDFHFDFPNPNLDGVPFTITVARHALGQNGGQFVFNPMSGIDRVTIPFTSAGDFDVSIEWHLTNYLVPAGSSNVGFESYNIGWTIVPEPSGVALLSVGAMGLIAGRVARQRRSCARQRMLESPGTD